MLSKLALFVSSGRKSPALISTPRRSRTEDSDSGRLSRWKRRSLVLGPVEPLERAVARIRLRALVDDVFDRGRENLERVTAGLRRTGHRHHSRAQLPNDLLRRRDIGCRRIDVVVLEREIAAKRLFAVAVDAIRLDD